MRRIATIIISCFMLAGCAAPLGMAVAGLAGNAATEAGSYLGREASTRMNLWLRDDDPAMRLDDRCTDDPDAGRCEPELLLAEYLRRTSPERREQVLAALPPDLRRQMETTLDGQPVPAYGFAPPAPQDDDPLLPSPLISPSAAAAP